MASLKLLFCKNWKSTKLVSYYKASLRLLLCKTGNQQNWYLTTWHLWSCSAKTGNQQNLYLTTRHLWGCCSAKLETNKTGSLPHGISGVVLQKLEINKTGVTFVKGTPGVSVHLEQQITALMHVQSTLCSFKNSTKENKHSRSLHFCEFKISTKHKWFSYSVWNL